MDNLRLMAAAQWGLAVLDAVPNHVALLDARGVIVAVNAAWERFALENGLRGGVACCGPGIDYPALCDAARGPSAEGAAEVAGGIRSVLAGSLPIFTLTYPCHSPQRQRWFWMMAAPLEVAGAATLVVHANITARKLEELRRHDSELRLQLALEATTDGLWDWNPQSGELYLSPGYFAMTGHRPQDEPASIDFFERLVLADDLPRVMATVEAIFRGDTSNIDMEFRMHAARGDIRWVRSRGRVVARDAAGAPLRMVGLITDITALKEAERKLQQSEARYRAVVEDQTDVIGRASADGKVLFVNEAFCRLHGKTSGELLGTVWRPTVHPDDLDRVSARLALLAPENPLVICENRVVVGNGEVRWMQFANRGFFDGEGRLLEIQSVGRDVTERHALEHELRHLLDENRRLGRELIRTQEKERTTLAKELHDELSQQLAAIRAYAGAIVRRTDGRDDRTRLDAEAIGKSAADIYAISHRLMEGLHPQALDSAGLVAAVGELVCQWSRSRSDLVICLRAATVGPCDAEVGINLFRIVQECLANAVQHGRPWRVRIFIGERRSGGRRRLRVVVRDDGVGMSLETPRTGYGLILMRERARNLGGHLDLRSRPGRGLRVAVDVPLPG